MLPIAKPHLTIQDVNAVKKAILSGWVTQGPKVAEFEKAFSRYVGAQFACAVSNCTTGLHMALLGVGVNPGDCVLTVSHSFIATANCVRHCFAEPIFIDVEENSFNISIKALKKMLSQDCQWKNGQFMYKHSKQLVTSSSPLRWLDKKKISGRVAAIVVVHQIGIPCDLKSIVALAKKYKVPVVEDAACAIGSEVKIKQWEKIGKPHGDVACFSFHPRKVLTTGEGGMLTTNNKKLDSLFRLLRHQGMSLSDVKRHRSRNVLIEEYPIVGYNYRMTDIQAALGVTQLQRIPQLIEKRRTLARYYIKKLNAVPWLKTYEEKAFGKTNWQSFPVRLLKNSPVTRNGLMQHLLDNNISSRPGIMNAHEELPYKNRLFHLPVSEELRRTTVLLPFFDRMTNKDIDKIIGCIAKLNP